MFEHGGNTHDCGCPIGNCDCASEAPAAEKPPVRAARKMPPWPSKVWRYRTVKAIPEAPGMAPTTLKWEVIDVFHNSYATVASAATQRLANVERDKLNAESVARYERGEKP